MRQATSVIEDLGFVDGVYGEPFRRSRVITELGKRNHTNH